MEDLKKTKFCARFKFTSISLYRYLMVVCGLKVRSVWLFVYKLIAIKSKKEGIKGIQ